MESMKICPECGHEVLEVAKNASTVDIGLIMRPPWWQDSSDVLYVTRLFPMM